MQPLTAQAGKRFYVDAIKFIKRNAPEIKTICTNANKVAGKTILTYKSKDGTVAFSHRRYMKLTSKKRKSMMETALKGVRKSGLNDAIRNRLYNFIAEQDSTVSATIKFLDDNTRPDFVQAMAYLRPFSGPVGTFLGVVSLVMFLLMSLSIVMDVCYLVLPMVKSFIDAIAKGGMPFGISLEAYSAYKEVEMSDGTVGVIGVFLKKRFPTLLLAGICVMYLVSGKIYDLLAWIMDLFDTMVNFQ